MRALLMGAAVAALSTSAHAAVFFNETFSYNDGALITESGGVWLSHGGGTTPLNVASGKAVINQGDTTGGRDDVNRPLGTGFDPATDNTSVLYAGFTANWSALPNAGSADGSYFAHFKSSAASEFYARINATTSGAAAGSFRVGITGESTTAVNTIEFGTDLSLNTDYRIIVRLDLATDKATLWVAPVSEASTSVTSVDTIGYAAGSINAFALRQGTSGSPAGFPGALTVDDLVTATTFNEVVPEPMSLSLAGLAGVAMLSRRRR